MQNLDLSQLKNFHEITNCAQRYTPLVNLYSYFNITLNFDNISSILTLETLGISPCFVYQTIEALTYGSINKFRKSGTQQLGFCVLNKFLLFVVFLRVTGMVICGRMCILRLIKMKSLNYPPINK